jgi:hypothetical protein
MRSLLRTSVLLLLLLLPPPPGAAAQYYSAHQLGKVNEVIVIVESEVDTECQVSKDSLKTAAELTMRRSGIKVVETRDAGYTLEIGLIGYELGDVSCVVHLGLEVRRHEFLSDGSLGLVLASSSGALLSGPRSALNGRLRDMVDELASELANEILKSRQ